MWCRCVPAATGLPDLTVPVELDTLNGFYVGSIFSEDGIANTWNYLLEKFRFRRKCDENSLIQLLARSLNTQGTGAAIEVSGVMAAVIRVK